MKTAIIFILLFIVGICLFKPVRRMISSSYNDCLSKGFTKSSAFKHQWQEMS